MISTNSEGVEAAFKRLSQSSFNEVDAGGNCTVKANDVKTILMALTLERGNVEQLQKEIQENATAYSMDEARDFFLFNSSGSIICKAENGNSKECNCFPEAVSFFESQGAPEGES